MTMDYRAKAQQLRDKLLNSDSVKVFVEALRTGTTDARKKWEDYEIDTIDAFIRDMVAEDRNTQEPTVKLLVNATAEAIKAEAEREFQKRMATVERRKHSHVCLQYEYGPIKKCTCGAELYEKELRAPLFPGT